MKKTLVAIAALAAFGAQAQSSVSITGVIDAGYQMVTNDKNSQAKSNAIANNGVSTSALFFKGTEDVGNGVKGLFTLELDFNPVINNSANQNSSTSSFAGTVYTGTPFNGEQFVGLESKDLGTLKLGMPNSPALDANAASQPFGTALGGGFSSSFGRLGTNTTSGYASYVGAEGSTGRIIRHQKAAVYTTPTFSGLTGQIEFAAKNANGGYTANDNGLLGLALKYNQGPLNAVFFNAKATAGAVQAAGSDTIAKLAGITSGTAGTVSVYTANPLLANASTTWNMLGANYNMGATTVYGGMTTTKTSDMTANGSIEDSKSYNVAAKYVMGNIDFLANYLVRKSNLTDAQAGFVATDANGVAYAADAKMLGLGANYNLSKTTSVYYRYESIKGLNSKISSTPATVASNGLAAAASYNNATQNKSMVGIRMAF